MKLYYTPRSHFSRKVRILLGAWNIKVALIDIGNVGDSNREIFGPNPLMKVPALVDDTVTVLDSDHIAQYLTRRFDPDDQFGVLTTDVELLNMRAVLNGAMAAEVEIILARRSGLDTSAYRRFDKIMDSVRGGLEWMEKHASSIPQQPSYVGFQLVCLWEHLIVFNILELNYPKLRAHVDRLTALPYVAATKPPPLPVG